MDGCDWGNLIGVMLVLAVLVYAAYHGPHDPSAA